MPDIAHSQPDWERLLSAERHIQHLVPGTILVGRTAAALHAEHRRSTDGDHVLSDLRDRFDTEIIGGLRVPTLAEMARIKAWLLATRNTVRDHLDLVVLLERLGPDIPSAFAEFDAIYAQPAGTSVLAEVIERLAAARPKDQALVELPTYRGLVAPWTNWQYVAARGRAFGAELAGVALGDK